MSAGIDLFVTQNDRQSTSSYSDSSLGFALRGGWAYTETLRQTLRYTLKQTNIYDVQYWASSVIQAQAGYSTLSELSTTLAWDTRDQRLNTTKGWLLRGSLSAAGPGGDQFYLRANADAAYFQPLFAEVVASITGSVGAIAPYANAYVRLNNLFFLGGDSLRGFAVGGVGPRDGYTTDSLGGTFFYTASAELSFPIPLVPKEVGLVGKAFTDVGSLWGVQSVTSNNTSVLSSELMRVSAGVGIQWASPFGPIRIDYALPLQYEPWDKLQNVRFSFGTRF